jgi:hypothetical protein
MLQIYGKNADVLSQNALQGIVSIKMKKLEFKRNNILIKFNFLYKNKLKKSFNILN